MVDLKTLHPGDRVFLLTAGNTSLGTHWRAVVDQVTENYVSLNWGLKPYSARCDVILKTSPLWQLLELVK